MNKNKNMILEGNLLRAIITLALPIMLNNLINSIYTLGDAFWVSKIGDTEVAAVNFVWPVSFLTISFAMGISVAGAAIISQYMGAHMHKEAQETAEQLYIFAILFGCFGSIVGMITTPSIIHFMGAEGRLYSQSVAFLRILFLELPFMFLMNIYFSINQSQGDTVTPTVLNASSAIFNIIIEPLFIFTFNLGIEGAALATVLSRVPFTIYALYRLSKGCNVIKVHPFKWHPVKRKMLDLIRIGIPSSLGNCSVALGFMVLFIFVVKHGESAMTALSIGNRLNSLAFMPAVGIGAALSTITGQNLGANNPQRVVKAYKISLGVALAFLMVTCSILWIFSRDLVAIFTKTDVILDMGSDYLKILAMSTWTIGFFNCSLGLFNGSGHTIHSMFLDTARLWFIRIPLIIILGGYVALGEKAIWYGISLSNFVAALLALLFAFSGVWKKPKIKDLSVLT
ncbi:MAG: MATE family efflux transporter [Vallitaleaceae bacterium]|nr:MATE family efflux transporter [Vallitaleaceae bacterium]